MVEHLAGPLVYRARLLLGPAGTPADAEEVAADALVAAWERVAEYDPARGTFRSWVSCS
ncbi:sigma factor [Thermaerobacter litoralis]